MNKEAELRQGCPMFNFLCFGFLYNHIQEDSNACSFCGRAGEGEVRQEKEGSHYQLGC